jgi:predicted RNA-binding protein with PUA-like domain
VWRRFCEAPIPASFCAWKQRSYNFMAHWLIKTEPSVYSYDDLAKQKRAAWDGVTNAAALKNIRSIQKGDELFVYHTGGEKQIVGIARAMSDAYPDPNAKDGKLVVFDIASVKKLSRPVTLAEIKARKEFGQWELVRQGRLSVMPVPEAIWKAILKMANE